MSCPRAVVNAAWPQGNDSVPRLLTRVCGVYFSVVPLQHDVIWAGWSPSSLERRWLSPCGQSSTKARWETRVIGRQQAGPASNRFYSFTVLSARLRRLPPVRNRSRVVAPFKKTGQTQTATSTASIARSAPPARRHSARWIDDHFHRLGAVQAQRRSQCIKGVAIAERSASNNTSPRPHIRASIILRANDQITNFCFATDHFHSSFVGRNKGGLENPPWSFFFAYSATIQPERDESRPTLPLCVLCSRSDSSSGRLNYLNGLNDGTDRVDYCIEARLARYY